MAEDALPWINPIGGLGDALMVSGVLKAVFDTTGRRFNLVRRTKYSQILDGHPAIAEVGHPPPDAALIATDYWSRPEYAAGMRAYQVLATIFGLPLPAEERLYLPGPPASLPFARWLPEGRRVALCPTSESPRKEWPWQRWEGLVRCLADEAVAAVQLGRNGDRRLRGTGSLAGLTTPRQAAALLAEFDAVVCCDSFLMHAAHLAGVPAVILWGPTTPAKYGYAGQCHLHGPFACPNPCLGPGTAPDYGTCCDMPHHCMGDITTDQVLTATLDAVGRSIRGLGARP